MLRFRSRHTTPLSDADLLARYRESGRAVWLGQLYERYLELTYGLCLKYLQSEADAEDAVMNIYEELTEKVRKHEIENFRSWLYVLAKNHCLMKLRRDNKNLTVTYAPHLMQSVDPRHHIMEITDKDNGEWRELQDCLSQLNDRQKQCIELFYLQGHSYQEIAECCALELGKVRSFIQNGRRNLRLCMEKKKGEGKYNI